MMRKGCEIGKIRKEWTKAGRRRRRKRRHRGTGEERATISSKERERDEEFKIVKANY